MNKLAFATLATVVAVDTCAIAGLLLRQPPAPITTDPVAKVTTQPHAAVSQADIETLRKAAVIHERALNGIAGFMWLVEDTIGQGKWARVAEDITSSSVQSTLAKSPYHEASQKADDE